MNSKRLAACHDAVKDAMNINENSEGIDASPKHFKDTKTELQESIRQEWNYVNIGSGQRAPLSRCSRGNRAMLKANGFEFAEIKDRNDKGIVKFLEEDTSWELKLQASWEHMFPNYRYINNVGTVGSRIIFGDGTVLLGKGTPSIPEQVREFHQRWCNGNENGTATPILGPWPLREYNPENRLIPYPLLNLTSKHPQHEVLGSDGQSLQPDLGDTKEFVKLFRRNETLPMKTIHWGGKISGWKRIWERERNLAEDKKIMIVLPFTHWIAPALHKVARERGKATLSFKANRKASWGLALRGWPFEKVWSLNGWMFLQVNMEEARLKHVSPNVIRDRKGHLHRLTLGEWIRTMKSYTLDEVQYCGLTPQEEPRCEQCVNESFRKEEMKLIRWVKKSCPINHLEVELAAGIMWDNHNPELVENCLVGLSEGVSLAYYGPRNPSRRCKNSWMFTKNSEAARELLCKLENRGFTTPWVNEKEATDKGFNVAHVQPLALVPKSKPGEFRLIRDNSSSTTTAVTPEGAKLMLKTPLEGINCGEAKMIAPLDLQYNIVETLESLLLDHPGKALAVIIDDIVKAFHTLLVRSSDWHLNGMQSRSFSSGEVHSAIMPYCDMGSRSSVTRWGLIAEQVKIGINRKLGSRMKGYVDDFYDILLEVHAESTILKFDAELKKMGWDTDKLTCADKGTLLGICIDLSRVQEGVALLRSKRDKDQELLGMLRIEKDDEKMISFSVEELQRIYMSLVWRAKFWRPLRVLLPIFLSVLRHTCRTIRVHGGTNKSRRPIKGSGDGFHLKRRYLFAAEWVHKTLKKWPGTDIGVYLRPKLVIYLVTDAGRGKSGTPHRLGGIGWWIPRCDGDTQRHLERWNYEPFEDHTAFIPKNGSQPASAAMEWTALLTAFTQLVQLGIRNAAVQVRGDCGPVFDGVKNIGGIGNIQAFCYGKILEIQSRHNIAAWWKQLPRTHAWIKVADKLASGMKPSTLRKEHRWVFPGWRKLMMNLKQVRYGRIKSSHH